MLSLRYLVLQAHHLTCKRHGVAGTERARLGGRLLLGNAGKRLRPKDVRGERTRRDNVKNEKGNSKRIGVPSVVDGQGSCEKGRLGSGRGERKGKRLSADRLLVVRHADVVLRYVISLGVEVHVAHEVVG